jgi:hypothetical protein
MAEITDAEVRVGDTGQKVRADCFGHNAAIECPNCDGYPVYLCAKTTKRGSSTGDPSICRNCGCQINVLDDVGPGHLELVNISVVQSQRLERPVVDPDFEEQLAAVREFFAHEVMGYMVKDIKSLQNGIKAEGRKYGECAAPLALVVCSAMNRLGELIGANDPKEIFIAEKTSEWLKCFCEQYMQAPRTGEWPYKTQAFQKVLYEVFRNGLAHQYMPKSAAITRDPGVKSVIAEKDGLVVLQSDLLANDFCDAVNRLGEKIAKAENHGPLISRIHKGLMFVAYKDEPLAKIWLEALRKRPEFGHLVLDGADAETSGTTTTISGTTTTISGTKTTVSV